MRVLDPKGCEISHGDDELTCSYPPVSWGCPGRKVPVDPKSTYYVWVTGMGDCAGDHGEYELTVETDVGGDPSLTLTTDDAPHWSTVVTSTGSIHIP